AIDTCGNESEKKSHHRNSHISGYFEPDRVFTLEIEKYEGMTYDKHYIFRGNSSEDMVLIDSADNHGYYTMYSDYSAPYDEAYYQAGIKLPEKYIIKINDSDREFNYSLSNLYLKARNNEAPYEILISEDRIDENLPEGTEIGVISALDEDMDDQHTFYLVSGVGSDDNNYFRISDNKLVTAVEFDHETDAELTVRIRVVDNGPDSLYYEKVIKIYINDLYETGLDNKLIKDEIIVIPNPVKDKALVQFPNEEGDKYILYLTNIDGEQIQITGTIASDKFELDRTGLSPGIYILLLRNNDKIFKTKVVIE
ncbi:MAG: T9SS type A sorting domain-containing protein, partial [Bacteroidales bacterium]